MSEPSTASNVPSNTRPLVLGTISFAVCFAAWGLVSAFAPRFRELFSLSATQTAFLVAVPVLLGSLARLPMGMLADRFGGRAVFTVLMLLVAVPAWLVPARGQLPRRCWSIAFFLGIAGSSFPVGVGYVSRWTPAGRQGTALGVYGLGNIGQSAAVFLGPLLAAAARPAVGLPRHGRAAGRLGRSPSACWRATPPRPPRPKGIGAMMRVLTRERLAWVLSLFYFLTFGGFVAFSIYLPTLLADQFDLTPADAGFRAAGFVVLATADAAGGRLAGRPHRRRARALRRLPRASCRSPCCSPGRRCCRSPSAPWAAPLCWGSGNGAVFKLVPQYFPERDGTVTGLVGRHGRPGRLLPAAAPRLLPRPAGRGLARASCCWPACRCCSRGQPPGLPARARRRSS